MLQEDKEFAENLIASMKDGFSVIDRQGVHLNVNTALCHMTGFTREELIGIGPPHPYWSKEDYENIEKAVQKTLRGEFEDFELIFKRKNGEHFPVIVTPSRVTDKEGNVISYFAAVKDISKHKKMEEVLRESEEKYRKLVEGMVDSVCIVNLKGRLLFANKASEKLTGYTFEGTKGQNIMKILPKKNRSFYRRMVSKAMLGKPIPYFETEIINKNGNTIPVETGGQLIEFKEGKAIQIVTRDITERKKAEEQIKTRLAYEKCLIEISNEALTNPNLDSFINFSLKKLGKLTNTSRTYIFNIHDGGKKTSNTHEWYAKGIAPQIKNLQNVECDMVPFWMKKLHKNEIINFYDVKDFPKPEREILETQDIKSILVVPMYTQKGLYGFMGFDECKKYRKWETNDAKLLRTASQIITQTIERKEAEEKLKKSELRLKKIFDLSPVGMVIATIDGKIEYVNNAACDMAGYKREEAIGMLTKDLFVDPEERDKSIEIIKKKGQRLNYMFHYKKKGGGTGFALTNSKLIDLNNGLRLVIELNDITKQKKLEKDRDILSKKVVKLTKKIPLTDNEKLVFYGLVKYPLLNDQQLSDKLNIKRSTITAIKNKLLRQGFYSTYIIPNFASIGCELMCILNGKAPIEDIEERKKIGIIKKVISFPEVVYGIGTDKDFLSIIISKNFVESKRLIDYVSDIYERTNTEMPNPVYFPFAMSRIVTLFDFSALLKSLFNLNIEEEANEAIKSTKRELSYNEKIILYALTKYPGLADTEIAAKIKISRPTVSQIKKNLIKENFLKITNIPDIKKLNCELLVYSSAKIDLEGSTKQNRETPSLIFMVDSKRENNSIFIFENYTKYKIEYDRLATSLKEGRSIIKGSSMHLFPVEQIKFQKMGFTPLVKKIFDLRVDF